MSESTASKRSRHSYRERIQEVIQERIALGKPLTHRDILKDAGGGSASTVVEELAKADRQTPATLIGRGAKSLPQRIAALEDALNASLAREKVLEAENQALKDSLTSAVRQAPRAWPSSRVDRGLTLTKTISTVATSGS